MVILPTPLEFAAVCASDGEFLLASRHWTGGLRLLIGEQNLSLTLTDGLVSLGDPVDGPGVLTLRGPDDVWQPMLAAVPPRFANDIGPARALGLKVEGDRLQFAQYGAAAQRAVELLRKPGAGYGPPALADRGDTPRFDSPIGKYVHLGLPGPGPYPVDYRIYYEEAGQGIPLLLQHTAGSNGIQWRHLFECREITDHFRLIAYDLPFHGKSVPPVSKRWWAEKYRLDGAFLRSVPVTLATALGLHRPAFMGCSVGGLLALDLAATHPGMFRSVISLEGALKVDGDIDSLIGFWHPQVSNESKARMMEGLTSPTSPDCYRKETTQAYAAGWPPLFIGDLHYYLVEYDLRDRAASIDTSKTSVHILSGEYDYSATVEMGRAAHEAIEGSTFTVMEGVGHFPMSENPDVFLTYLLPVLDCIRALQTR